MEISRQDRVRGACYEYRWLLSCAVLALLLWLLQGQVNTVGGDLALALGSAVRHIVAGKPFVNFPGFYYMNFDWADDSAGSPGFAALFGAHLTLVVEAVAVALALSLPLGLALHRFRRLYLPAFALFDGIYTIPSLLIFPLLIKVPYLGISNATVIVVVAAYAQYILVRNVFAGLDTVPPEVKESARGMGMSRLQILLHIEFPLALPVIVAGVRIATVAGVGIVSIASLTGVADLGQYLFSGHNGGGNGTAEIEAGAVGVVALALGADLLLKLVERMTPANRVARASR